MAPQSMPDLARRLRSKRRLEPASLSTFTFRVAACRVIFCRTSHRLVFIEPPRLPDLPPVTSRAEAIDASLQVFALLQIVGNNRVHPTFSLLYREIQQQGEIIQDPLETSPGLFKGQ